MVENMLLKTPSAKKLNYKSKQKVVSFPNRNFGNFPIFATANTAYFLHFFLDDVLYLSVIKKLELLRNI